MPNKKIRLLQIIPSLDIGGAQRFLVDLCKNFDKEKFEIAVCVLVRKTHSFLESELRRNRIPMFFLNLRWTFHPLTISRLTNLFKSFKPDVIHTHLRAIRYVLIPSHLARIPVHIHTIHNLAKYDTSFFFRGLNRMAFKYLNVIPVSISKEVARSVKATYGVDSVVIYNGIPSREYFRDRRKGDNLIKILNIGKFKKAKNHLLLVEAFSKAVKEMPNLRLHLVGDGSLRRKVENRVKKLGLEEKVFFWGWRSDIPEILADCDIFALSSDWEGFGIVLIEAMASGKPIVATDVGGIPEVVEDEITGILVPPRDPEALANAILRLAKDEKLRKEFGERGREKAIKEFDIKIAVKNYERVYLQNLEMRQRWKNSL
ncbi:glycosyltransferase [bacterium]|nr:glycosyltransferase [bacterium]